MTEGSELHSVRSHGRSLKWHGREMTRCVPMTRKQARPEVAGGSDAAATESQAIR